MLNGELEISHARSCMTALMHFLDRTGFSIEVHTRLLWEGRKKKKKKYPEEKLGHDVELPHNITVEIVRVCLFSFKKLMG